MIEILQIIFQLFLFIFLTSFPVNKYLFNQSSSIKKLSFLSSLSINSLFLIFLLLFFSFFKIDLIYVFYFIFFIYSLLFLKIFSSKKRKINNKNWPLIIFFLFALVCVFFKTSYQFELGWDGFSWKEKANFFYNGGYLFDINDFTETYQNYPHLGGYIWAFFWKNSFLGHEYIGRLFYDYIYITSLFAIILNFQNLNNLKKIFIFILLFFCTFDDGLGGYQDYLIFSILTIFAAQLVNHYFNKDNYLFYTVFIFSGILLPWIKVEGFFYSIFLIIIFLIYEFQFNKNKKKNLKFLFLSLIIFSLLIRVNVNNFVLGENTLFQSNLFNFFNSDLNLEIIFTKTYYIFFYTINSFFKYPIWLFNSFGLLLSLYFLKNIKVLKVFLIFFILNFLFIFSIYFTTSTDIVWYLAASLDRLVLQTSGFYFVIFSLFNKRIIKF
tara:strand:- start:105 stop:1415 length:1311 start_codon:yes stop_codon:yes gene_type:complete